MKKYRDILLALGWLHNSLLEGTARYASEHPWHLDISPVYAFDVDESWQGDGIITNASRIFANSLFRRKVNKLTQPKILINDDIMCDYRAAGIMAADHFLEKGYTTFGVFGPNETSTFFIERVEEHGYQPHRLSFDTAFNQPTWQKKQQALASMLKSLSKPIAIFAPADIVAADVMQAALNAGLSIPDDIAILGKDNNALFCNAVAVPLSSIDMNLDALGYHAARLLDQLLDGTPLPDAPFIITPRGIVERQSTNTLAVTALEAERAIRFLQENHGPDITIDIIAAKTGCSPRSLYRILKKHLGQTIGEALFFARLHHAEDLLLNSSEKQFNIAYQAGFGSVQNFHKAFIKAHGTSPGKWKQHHKSG